MKNFKEFINEDIKSEKIEIFLKNNDLYIYKSNSIGGIDNTNPIRLIDFLKNNPYIVKELNRIGIKNTTDIVNRFGEKNLKKIDITIGINGSIVNYNEE